MGKVGISVILVVIFVSSVAQAEIVVHEPNFVVDVLLNQIDGQTPYLEAIRNTEGGSGVVAASVDEGIFKVFRISPSSIDLIGTMSGYPISPVYGGARLRFDCTGLFDNDLYATVLINLGGGNMYSDFVHISSTGVITKIERLGGAGNAVSFLAFDFTSGQNGYTPGAYLMDGHVRNGTSLYHMDVDFNFQILSQDHLPDGRSDLDIYSWEFDRTGLYNNYLTAIDSDDTDHKALIYQLLPDLSWEEMSDVVTTTYPYYRDSSFSSGGAFGQMLYVTNQTTEEIQSVDPNGVHEVFASGFSMIESITISDDGEFMYVSDENGIYRIRATTVGPTLVMQEPKVASDGVFTDPAGASSLRLLWNEPVVFTNSDVSIIDEDSNPISLSVLGSNSQFMIIAFGQSMLNDKYTITIKDTVVSAETGNLIDGDEDGFAGGDAVIVMEHRERHDSDNDNDIDLLDFGRLAEKWLWEE